MWNEEDSQGAKFQNLLQCGACPLRHLNSIAFFRLTATPSLITSHSSTSYLLPHHSFVFWFPFRCFLCILNIFLFFRSSCQTSLKLAIHSKNGLITDSQNLGHCPYHGVNKIKCCRYRPDVDQMVGRDLALLFYDCGTRRGWVVSSTPRPHFTTGKEPVPILQEAGWVPGPVQTAEKSRLHRDSIPELPACSQPLYWLSYRAHIME